MDCFILTLYRPFHCSIYSTYYRMYSKSVIDCFIHYTVYNDYSENKCNLKGSSLLSCVKYTISLQLLMKIKTKIINK